MALSETHATLRILRRVGVVGDIHCEDEVLELVLRHFGEVGADTLLAVGDVVDGSGDVNKVCSLLAGHGVLAVSGNHDRWILAGSMRDLPDATPVSALCSEARDWLTRLPKTRSYQTPRGRLLLCHGLGEDDMAALRPSDEGYAIQSNFALQTLVESKRFRIVINGHTHLAMVRTVGHVTIINAGTLDRRDRQVCSVVDFERGRVEFFSISQGRIASAESFALP